MGRLALNLLLVLGIALCLGLYWTLDRKEGENNWELLLEAQMSQSPAFDSFAPNPNFSDGMTLRTPPAGTIPRGELPLHYEATPADFQRAGKELQNPLPADNLQVVQRGARLFENYCKVCHGPTGLGDGPVTQYRVPTPLSMLTGKAVQMSDGEIFHVLTYGQANMPPYSLQLSTADRWCLVTHVRQLQKKLAVPPSVRLADTIKTFQNNCAACHGQDGTGSLMRAKLHTIPDFTSRAWQVSQTDLEIINRIDYGDMPQMPTFHYKLTRDQILALAAYVRLFAATGLTPTGATASSAPAGPPANLTPVQIFRAYCLACHNVDGKGGIVRAAFPDIPDFTLAQWHSSKSDATLAQSVLSGGKFMPPMKDKLSTADAERMVKFIRGFQGGKQVVSLGAIEVPKQPVPVPAVIAEVPAAPKTTPAAPQTTTAPIVAASAPSVPAQLQPSEDLGARIRAGAVIFRLYCIVCHGPEGTGSLVRSTLPPIPDFTSKSFHADHSDQQLLISILDGKGTLMPPNRGRVTEAQARDLVAYVRAFGPPVVRAPFTSEGSRTANDDFQKRFSALQQQFETLEKQLKSMSRAEASKP
jgi:mono/diheme cytochrome c family protein